MRKQILWIVLSSLLCVASGCGIVVTQSPQEIERAYDAVKEKAEDGDCVLLSPACASWGMFDNYEQRGDMFKEQVRGYLK